MKLRMTHAVFPSFDSVVILPRRWENGCNHKEDEYLGTVAVNRLREGRVVAMVLDVYVHEGDLGLADVCMRYGDEGHEYISAGSVLDFLVGDMGRKIYPEVAALVLKKMEFSCERAR